MRGHASPAGEELVAVLASSSAVCFRLPLPAQPRLYPAAHGGNRLRATGIIHSFSQLLAGYDHGEVPDPHQHSGERSPADDQPLLSGCEGSGVESWASYAG